MRVQIFLDILRYVNFKFSTQTSNFETCIVSRSRFLQNRQFEEPQERLNWQPRTCNAVTQPTESWDSIRSTDWKPYDWSSSFKLRYFNFELSLKPKWYLPCSLEFAIVNNLKCNIIQTFFKKTPESTLLSLVESNQDKCSRFKLFIIILQLSLLSLIFIPTVTSLQKWFKGTI